MNIFRKIFGYWNDDWEIKYYRVGVWNISYTDEKLNFQEYCRFYFEYSKRLDKWRLRGEGHNYKDHHLYEYFINNFDDYTAIITDPVRFEQHKAIIAKNKNSLIKN